MRKEIEEIWKPINGYEGIYEVSNHGRVKSIARQSDNGKVGMMQVKEKIRALVKHGDNYLRVGLWKGGKVKKVFVHRLVYEAFIGEIPKEFEVDHIDSKRDNNRPENLQAISHRENLSKDQWRRQRKPTSKYTGVCWDKRNKRWRAGINNKGKLINLGIYKTEVEAHQAYQKALEAFDNKFKSEG